MADKDFNILLNKYNTAIAKAQDLEEQLETKKKQWETREENFKITEKLLRELCEDILAKDPNEMVLGTDYSWSSISINELVLKSKKVFRTYNAQRTDFMRKLMDISEKRLQEIESLNEQISVMRLNPGTASISQEELKRNIEKEKQTEKASEMLPQKIQDKSKRGGVQIIVEDSDKSNAEQQVLENMADINALMQITPKAVPISQGRRRIEEKKKRKKEKTMAHQIDLKDYEAKLTEAEWQFLKIIGEKGFSRYQLIEEYFLKTNPKFTKNKCRVAAANLSNIGLLRNEKVSNPIKGQFAVYQLTDMGNRIYSDRYKKTPVMSEMDLIIAEHDNCMHGYGIRTVRELLEEKGIFQKVYDTNRKRPIKLGDGISYIPDIVCIDDNGTKLYIEYECANHTQANFNAKCNKMSKVTSVLNFVGPNKETLDTLCTQVKAWIKNRGATSLRHVTIRITGATQMKDTDLLTDEGWKYVFYPAKNEEPVVNF